MNNLKREMKKLDALILRGHVSFFSLLQPRLNSGTMSVSEKLRTYPSFSPTLTLTYYQLTVTGLGEG